MDTAYDGEQTPAYISYPYFSNGISSTKATANSAEPGDTSLFDALGRATSVTHADGAAINTSYPGTYAAVTDAAGRRRDLVHDGLGRLAEVREYTDSDGDHYSTYYGYGLLDDLKAVTQDSETRSAYTGWRHCAGSSPQLSRRSPVPCWTPGADAAASSLDRRGRLACAPRPVGGIG
ncbi:MAG: hypothetical protein ACRD01_14390 [Terriglobales bacterium]